MYDNYALDIYNTKNELYSQQNIISKKQLQSCSPYSQTDQSHSINLRTCHIEFATRFLNPTDSEKFHEELILEKLERGKEIRFGMDFDKKKPQKQQPAYQSIKKSKFAIVEADAIKYQTNTKSVSPSRKSINQCYIQAKQHSQLCGRKKEYKIQDEIIEHTNDILYTFLDEKARVGQCKETIQHAVDEAVDKEYQIQKSKLAYNMAWEEHQSDAMLSIEMLSQSMMRKEQEWVERKTKILDYYERQQERVQAESEEKRNKFRDQMQKSTAKYVSNVVKQPANQKDVSNNFELSD